MIFENLLPTRVSYGRGAGYTFDTLTGLLVVDTSRGDRRYVLSAVPHGWRVSKLDEGTDPTEDHYHVERAGYKCCCRGFVRFGYCVHADCCRDLDNAGYLEHGEDRPEPAPYTDDEIDANALAWELACETLAGPSELLTSEE